MKFYQKAILFSLALHFSIGLFLVYSPSNNLAKNYVLKKVNISKKQIIQTSAIDSSQVDKEIERLQSYKKQQQIKQQQLQRELKNQANQARLDRLKEEKKITQIKKRQRNLLRKERRKVLALKKKRRLEKALLLKGQKKLKDLQETLAHERAEQAKEQQKRKLELAKKKADKIEKARLKKIDQERKQALLEKKQQQAKIKQQDLINAEINKYKALIINAISQNWILPTGVDSTLSCRFEIQLASSGQVINVKLLKTSGDPVLDRSAQTAIYNASPLPVPATPEAFDVFKVVRLTVKPENVIPD